MRLTQETLEAETAEIAGGDIRQLDDERLYHLITVVQHTFDVLLNEVERRGGITIEEGHPVVPYDSDYTVPTILTRDVVQNKITDFITKIAGSLQQTRR